MDETQKTAQGRAAFRNRFCDNWIVGSFTKNPHFKTCKMAVFMNEVSSKSLKDDYINKYVLH